VTSPNRGVPMSNRYVIDWSRMAETVALAASALGLAAAIIGLV